MRGDGGLTGRCSDGNVVPIPLVKINDLGVIPYNLPVRGRVVPDTGARSWNWYVKLHRRLGTDCYSIHHVFGKLNIVVKVALPKNSFGHSNVNY